MIQKVNNFLDILLSEGNIFVYEVKMRKEDNNDILSVLVDKKSGNVSIDDVVEISNKLNSFLDEIDKDMPPYSLEVASVGAEKELRCENEVNEAVGKFIYGELKNTINDLNLIEGKLLSFDNNSLLIEYKDKNIRKEFITDYNNFKFLRLSVMKW